MSPIRYNVPYSLPSMAERIPDSPENIARAIFATPPKKPHEWDYMKRSKAK